MESSSHRRLLVPPSSSPAAQATKLRMLLQSGRLIKLAATFSLICAKEGAESFDNKLLQICPDAASACNGKERPLSLPHLTGKRLELMKACKLKETKKEHHSVGDLCLCGETRLTGTNCWPRSCHQSLSSSLLKIHPRLPNLVFRVGVSPLAAHSAPPLPNLQLGCHCLCLGRLIILGGGNNG